MANLNDRKPSLEFLSNRQSQFASTSRFAAAVLATTVHFRYAEGTDSGAGLRACGLLITVMRRWIAVAAIAVPTGVATIVSGGGSVV